MYSQEFPIWNPAPFFLPSPGKTFTWLLSLFQLSSVGHLGKLTSPSYSGPHHNLTPEALPPPELLPRMVMHHLSSQIICLIFAPTPLSSSPFNNLICEVQMFNIDPLLLPPLTVIEPLTTILFSSFHHYSPNESLSYSNLHLYRSWRGKPFFFTPPPRLLPCVAMLFYGCSCSVPQVYQYQNRGSMTILLI